MVNGVSQNYNISQYAPAMRIATSTAVLHKNDVENMVKFLNGQPLGTTEDPSIGRTALDTVPMLALFGAFQGGAALKQNGWNIKNTINNVNAASPYKTRGQAMTAAKEQVSAKFKDVFKKSVAVDPKRGFIGKALDKIPGYKALRGSGFGQMMGQKGTGAGWMAVFDGLMETFTQVVPTFQQLGAEAGFKQLGKSGAKVLGGTVGWVAGDAIGRGAGAAIGTLICPGVGTAIGSFVGGFLGGILGSAAAGKAVKAVTGKSELEKNAEAQMAQTTQQLEADPQTKLALAQQTIQQADQILAQDPQNKDALAAKASAEKIIIEEAAKAEQTAQLTQNQVNGYAPSFKGYSPLGFDIPVVPGFNGYGYEMEAYRQGTAEASTAFAPQTNPFVMPQQLNPFAQQQLLQQQALQQPTQQVATQQ